jgi:hypothetical protein
MRLTQILLASASLTLSAASLLSQGGRGGGRGGGPPAKPAAERVLVVPGQSDGARTFPLVNYPETKPLVEGQMDFKHYHTTAEANWWMKKWAADKPDLVDVYTVGKSFGGADIWQMTLTNKKTGRHTDKPAAFFEGGRHSGEISGTEATLYLAWYLIENYGKNPEVTKMLDEKTVYIKPNNNPDGGDMYRLTAQANRSSVRPVDDDGDGLFDEDPPEDINGDGYITQMRKFVGAGKGNAVVDTMDKKGRLMRQVGMGNGDYMMYPEGWDNDKDGRINEDGIGGLDLHRNYPYNWRPMSEFTGRGTTQFGAGEYPMSEPESRNVVLWTLQHPNIGAANSMDTSVPMHLRAPSTCDQAECMFPADMRLYQHFDTVGLKITGYPWAGDVYREYSTRGNPNLDPQALYGHGPEYGYFHLGIVWYGDEIWNGGREKDYDKNGTIDQYEVLRYCDEEFGGTCMLPWTKGIHPEHGEIEAGGANPKFWSQNSPPAALEKWAGNQARFNLELIKALPKLEITNVAITTVATGRANTDTATHELKVTVKNHGIIPTALERAKLVKIVQPDRLTIQGAPVRILGRRANEFYVGGNETKVVTLRLRVAPGDLDKTVTLNLNSTRGGQATKELRIPR